MSSRVLSILCPKGGRGAPYGGLRTCCREHSARAASSSAAAAVPPLATVAGPFGSVRIPTAALGCGAGGAAMSPGAFERALRSTLAAQRAAGVRIVWLECPMAAGALLPAAEAAGFVFHAARGGSATLYAWLGPGASPIPVYATTHVGVGGIVLNAREEVGEGGAPACTRAGRGRWWW